MQDLNKVLLSGRIGRITPVGNALKISIASKNSKRNKEGSWIDNPRWNTVTVFNENTINFVNRNLAPGDKIRIEGLIQQTSWQDKKSGETRYDVTISVHDLQIEEIKDRDEGPNGQTDDGPLY